MATVVTTARGERDWPHLILNQDLTTIVSDAALDLTHGGPANLSPDYITLEVRTPSSPVGHVTLLRDTANDDASAGTVRVKVIADQTTDLKVRVSHHFYPSHSGGIS